MDPDELRRNLSRFAGTTTYFAHGTSWLRYTDGVRYLAEHAQAFWLVDQIAFLQPRARRDAWLREFQLWELHVADDRSARLVCSRDTEDSAFAIRIPSTDFPLPYIRLYVEGGVLLLPSEH